MTTFQPDWDALKTMIDDDIQQRALSDADAQPTTKADWNKARVIMPESDPKQAITMRVSPKVIAFFKEAGKGYQSRMNAVLEAYVDQEIQHKNA